MMSVQVERYILFGLFYHGEIDVCFWYSGPAGTLEIQVATNSIHTRSQYKIE